MESLDPWQRSLIGSEIWGLPQADPALLRRLQGQRLARLMAHARAHSALYRRRWRGLALDGSADACLAGLSRLPPLGKAELMDEFEAWVTDPALRLDALRRFTADPARIGEPYLGRYTVWESSGSSGVPGVFVQDAFALAVYDALELLRRPWSVRRLLDPLFAGERIAFVGATGGHFAAVVAMRRLQRLNPWLAGRVDLLSFLQPMPALVARLQALQPTLIGTYPNTALLLAEEQRAGRLALRPQELRTGGETLTPAMRRFIEQAFGCPVVDNYGASEFYALASACRCGRLHLNSDWALLESVDDRGQPVPPGETGSTALLTHLANLTQPLLRYDLGDRIRLPAERCDCGSRLPLVEVEGRHDDLLRLPGRHGGQVGLTPLALCTVLEEEAGLFDFQLVQRGPAALALAVPQQGEAAQQQLARGRQAVDAYLARQGARPPRWQLVDGQPLQRGPGGKLQRVVALGARRR